MKLIRECVGYVTRNQKLILSNSIKMELLNGKKNARIQIVHHIKNFYSSKGE